MTGWNWVDAVTDWVRRRPVTFFLGCLGLYWLACLWGY